jgi:hypothetical protein
MHLASTLKIMAGLLTIWSESVNRWQREWTHRYD